MTGRISQQHDEFVDILGRNRWAAIRAAEFESDHIVRVAARFFGRLAPRGDFESRGLRQGARKRALLDLPGDLQVAFQLQQRTQGDTHSILGIGEITNLVQVCRDGGKRREVASADLIARRTSSSIGRPNVPATTAARVTPNTRTVTVASNTQSRVA